ncbi:MAG: VIT family protein [Micrococcales bacterium]|nr:VIT family protein [Micrococcales bacterium]NBR54890.1 VIT family protein [Micrococcales bacterium]
MTKPSYKEQPLSGNSNEFQRNLMASKLNWLRAGVLGANDGVMSVSGVVLGVAASTNVESTAILVAGVAAVVAGSISMAGGEYTSVSAQRDSEKAALEIERTELANDPEGELRELAWFYEQKGISPKVALLVAEELTSHDALAAHAEAELGIDPNHHVSPIQAALSSLVAFAAGGLLPLLAVIGPWEHYRVQATVGSVVLALVLTGFVGAKIGGAKPARGIVRNVFVSSLTMGVTYLIGLLVGTHLI